jgi:hypothetical protein
MIVLDLVPVRWFSADMNVLQEGVLLAELRFSSWRENGSIRSGGSIYSIRKDGMFSNCFLLEEDGHGLCYASMKGFWRRIVVLDYEGIHYVLKSTGWGRRVNFFREGLEIGTVYGSGFFGRGARAEVGDGIPLVIQTFLLWLTVLGWNRDAAS